MRIQFDWIILAFFSSLDATKDDGSFGRLVNDSKYFPNSKIKQMEIDGSPRLYLFALKNIVPGEEIRYFYGDDDLPWHADVSISNELTLMLNINGLKLLKTEHYVFVSFTQCPVN